MILSVSRRTDIPAFYSKWFFNRLKEGFVYVRNPMNPKSVSRIPLNKELIDCIVFWTKNPSQEFLQNLHLISDIPYYILFTITSYGKDIEQNVPQKKKILESFKSISDKIGPERVIWRYDPILLSNKYTTEYHIKYFEKLAQKLAPYTQKCIISLLTKYKKCETNLKNTTVREPNKEESEILAHSIKETASSYTVKIETCAMVNNLIAYGINPGKCIDNELIEKITGKKTNIKKDKNQRAACNCIESIDIGTYNTCPHNCLYCYANINANKVFENYKQQNTNSPLLIGQVKPDDVISERKVLSVFRKTLFN